MKIAVALAVAVVGTVPLEATSIVAFRQADGRIILAADSRVGWNPPLACKIRTGRWSSLYGGIIFAPFNVPDAAAEMLRDASTLAEARVALVQRLVPRLEQAVTGAERRYGVGALVADILIAGRNPGDSTLRLGLLNVDVASHAPMRLRASWLECPGSAWCEADGSVRFGASYVEDGIWSAPLPLWLRRGDAAAARRLIQQHIEAAPEKVSGPIDVLEIDATGPHLVDGDPQSTCRR